MTSGSVAVLTVAVAAVALLALVAVLVVYFTARGPARAGLASVGATAALVGPVAGIGAASYALIQVFSALSLTGAGGSAAVLAGMAEAMLPIRVGFAAAALTLVVASLLAWIGRGDRPRLPLASPRRLIALAMPGVVSFLVVGGAGEYSRRTRDIVIDVVAAPAPAKPSTAEDQAEPAAEARPSAAGSIAETSRRVSLGVMAGVFGVPFLFLVLMGFAAATAILAWRVQVPTSFAAVSSAWMLLQAALWAAAVFVVKTPPPAA